MGCIGSLGAVSPQTLGLAMNCEEDPSLMLTGLVGSCGLGLATNHVEDRPLMSMGVWRQSLHRLREPRVLLRQIHKRRQGMQMHCVYRDNQKLIEIIMLINM